MPRRENSISSTRRCTSRGNFTRSFGHHAPEAPNPSILCAGAASTCATGSSCPCGVGAGSAVAAALHHEHDMNSASTPAIKALRRIFGTDRTGEEPAEVGTMNSGAARSYRPGWQHGPRCRGGGAEVTKLRKKFTAKLQKSAAKGGWTYVVMPGSAEYFGTRGLVKV